MNFISNAVFYTYDDMGRLISESTTSGGTKSYEYNELNVRKKITNARKQVRKLFYDAKGRISGYTAPEGPVSYIYDQNDNVLTVINKNGSTHRTYDALNRVSSYTDTYGKVIRYEYDAVGNLSKIIYPDNTAVIRIKGLAILKTKQNARKDVTRSIHMKRGNTYEQL